VDHRAADGVHGLVTLIGIRFTTARGDAARAVDLLLQQGPKRPAAPDTAALPLHGGEIEDFAAFASGARAQWPTVIPSGSLDGLLRNHGTAHREVLQLATADASGLQCIDGTSTLVAEIWQAIDREMAVRLEDVVLRRTDLAAGSHPGREALQAVARVMAARLGWSAERLTHETAATERALAWHLAKPGKSRAALRPAPADAGRQASSPRPFVNTA
jgi:glycerol-3-phosphate dehydrogenase